MTDEEHDAIIAGLRRRTYLAVRVYEILCAAAEIGAPCPTNLDVCAALKSSGNPTSISCCLKTLRKAGLISLVSGINTRQVTITRTGHSTAAVPVSQQRDVNQSYRSSAGGEKKGSALAGATNPGAWIVSVRRVILQKLADGVRC